MYKLTSCPQPYADPESFVRGCPTQNIFLVYKGKEDPNTTKSGSSSAHQRPNVECWLGSFVIFHGIRTSIDKEPYRFVIFQVRSGSPPPPSGSAIYLIIRYSLLSSNVGYLLKWSKIFLNLKINEEQISTNTGSDGSPRGFGDLGRMAIYFQGAGEHW